MSRRKEPRNTSDDPDRDRIDGEGLEWAVTQVREWRRRVGNRAEIDGHLLARQMLRLAERGLQESLCGYVILGCEWMFRLRTSGPQDAQIVLARIEGRLLPILGDEAWFVTEALAASVRKLLKQHRTLAAEWEDEPKRVVVTEPDAIGIVACATCGCLRNHRSLRAAVQRRSPRLGSPASSSSSWWRRAETRGLSQHPEHRICWWTLFLHSAVGRLRSRSIRRVVGRSTTKSWASSRSSLGPHTNCS